MRDTDVLLTELGLPAEGYLQNWIHPQNGQTYRQYRLPKDLTITLVSGYNVAMRHRIVTRWMELEEQKTEAVKVPTSFREALLLAASLEVVTKGEGPLVSAHPHPLIT